MAKPTLEFQNVLAKPFGEIKKKEHTFAEALDHFAEVIGSLPNFKNKQLQLLEVGGFLSRLKIELGGDTKSFGDFIAKSELGSKAKLKWGKGSASEISKLILLSTQHKNAVEFVKLGTTDSLSGTGLLKAFNNWAKKEGKDLAVSMTAKAVEKRAEQAAQKEAAEKAAKAEAKAAEKAAKAEAKRVASLEAQVKKQEAQLAEASKIVPVGTTKVKAKKAKKLSATEFATEVALQLELNGISVADFQNALTEQLEMLSEAA